MAWPRIKNSRSSAQPGKHQHDGVQVTVTPAPDAERPAGSGQNIGVGGTRHAVAYENHGADPVAPVADAPRGGWRRRPIRYAHEAPSDAGSPDAISSNMAIWDAASANQEFSEPVAAETVVPGPTVPGTVISGTVLPQVAPTFAVPEAYEPASGLIYETPQPAYAEPVGPNEPEVLAKPVASQEPPGKRPVANEGLGIFGGVATTEVPEDTQPAEPPRVIPIGAAWNQPIASTPLASDDADDSRPNPFGRMRGMRLGGAPADEHEPRVSVRDLPPDVQVRFWRIRSIIMAVVGVLFGFLTKSWEIGLTLAILAGIIDTIYRSRNAAAYQNGGSHPGARRRTSRQIARLRRDGYVALDARPIPNSREFIDHLIIGPTGVYAIDSEKWDPKLPVRTWNGKKLYLGPESQKDRLEHAVWEAGQASEILSGALGTEIVVRPALAIYGPKIPWDIATIRNVDVFTGSALRKYLKRRGRMKEDVPRLTREEIRTIYDTASRMLPDVAPSVTPTPVG